MKALVWVAICITYSYDIPSSTIEVRKTLVDFAANKNRHSNYNSFKVEVILSETNFLDSKYNTRNGQASN